ncbi:lysoplasmalogenase family protein [Pontimicrobium sp. MEBiC01747]
MSMLFKNFWCFSVLYIVLLIIDSYIKVNMEAFPYRYITKTLLIFSLIVFFIVNEKKEKLTKVSIVILALLSFTIGDVFLINSESSVMFVIGSVFFALGKILYAIRFSNKEDFNILKLIPFLLFCFVYMCSLMMLVYNNLGDYFIFLLMYLFIVMILAQFAYLRKNEVNKISYWLVLVGVILSMFSDSLTILKQFYDNSIAYNHITIMLFYGMSQYFIVLGIVKERKKLNTV